LVRERKARKWGVLACTSGLGRFCAGGFSHLWVDVPKNGHVQRLRGWARNVLVRHRKKTTMKAKKSGSGIDGVANKGKSLARLGGRISEAAGAAADALSQVVPTAIEGGHRLAETASRVGDVAQEMVSEVIHSAEDARQREIHLAKEMAAMAHHRRQELADSVNYKRFGQ
jgi:hypothetical protein